MFEPQPNIQPVTKDQEFYADSQKKDLTERYLRHDPDQFHNVVGASELISDLTEMLTKPLESVQISDLKNLNKCIGGLRPREFTILCGATGVGKTTLCANISMALFNKDVPQYVFSVETGDVDYLARMASVKFDYDLNDGRVYEPSELMKINYLGFVNKLKTSKSLYLGKYDNRISVEQIMSDIYVGVVKHGIKVAIIDNLNFLMEVTRAADQIVEMDRVIHELIIFCKQVDVHIIMVMHPKKTDNGRVESEFDIKGSSTAVQEAQNIILFNRVDKKMEERILMERQIDQRGSTVASIDQVKFYREIKIAKLRRRGRAVGSKIILKTQNGVRYEEIDKYSEMTI